MTTVTFNSAFASAPVIMAQAMTDNGSEAIVMHNRQVTTTGFRTQMNEQEGSATSHATETIGWIAIEDGGTVADGLVTGTTGNNVTHNVSTQGFGGTLASTTPVVLMDQQTEDGGNTAGNPW